MKRGRVLAIVAGVCTAGAACASLKEAPITEPVTEAGTETSTTDAATDAPADAPADTRTIDVEPDAGVVFSDDFDDGGRSPEWTDYAASGTVDAGDVAVRPPARSPPNALHVTNPQAPFYGGIQWSWPANGSKTRLRVSLDFFVTTAPTAPATVVMNVIDGNLLHEADNSPAPILAILPDPLDGGLVRLCALNLQNNTPTVTGHVLEKVPIGAWHHIEMSYEPVPVDSDLWRVTWALGTPPAPPTVAYSKVVPRPEKIDTSKRTTFLGIQADSGQADIAIDNVMIDLR